MRLSLAAGRAWMLARSAVAGVVGLSLVVVSSPAAAATRHGHAIVALVPSLVMSSDRAKPHQLVTADIHRTTLPKGDRLSTATIAFGDGAPIIRLRSLSGSGHRYRRSGRYPVTLTVTDTQRNRKAITAVVTVGASSVNAPPKATTTVLAGGQLVGLSGAPEGRQTATLTAGTPVPAVGAAVVSPPAPAAPDGIVSKVAAVSVAPSGRLVVALIPATLDEAYSHFSVDAAGTVGAAATAAAALSTTRIRGALPSTTKAALVHVPSKDMSCRRSDKGPVVGAGPMISADLDLSDLSWELHLADNNRTLHFRVSGPLKFTATLANTVAMSCTLTTKKGVPIPIPGTPLKIILKPMLNFSVGASFGVTWTWTPHIDYGFDVGKTNDRHGNFTNDPLTLDATGTASADIMLGISAEVSLAGRLGVEVDAGPDFAVTGTATVAQDCLDVSLTWKVAGSASADVFIKHWTFAVGSLEVNGGQIVHKCHDTAPPAVPAPPTGPTPPPTGPTPAPPANANTVWAWGTTAYTPYANSDVPLRVSGLAGVTAVAGGISTGYALLSDGTVRAWGDNEHGAFGDGTTVSSDVPVQVHGLTEVSAIAGGGADGYALLSNGTVWSWGDNYYGELGNGSNTNSDVPVEVSGLTGVTAIAGGDGGGYALRSNGTVWAWGRNAYGALGDGSTTDSNVPVEVSGLTGATAIAGGDRTGYAVRSDGTVWAWGRNFSGQLGNGSNTDSHTPVQVSGLTGVTAVAAAGNGGYGPGAGYALRSNGTIWSWGVSLGDGTATTQSDVPVQVSGLTSVTAIAGGYLTGFALRADGTVWSWGGFSGGILGDGSGADYAPIPVPVSGLTGVSAIAAGDNTGLAIRSR